MPAARKTPGETPAETQDTAEPAFYEPLEPLYVYNPDAGVAPACAFLPGDRVPPELVDANGWGDLVAIPAEYRALTAPPDLPPRPAPAAVTPDQPAAAKEQ